MQLPSYDADRCFSIFHSTVDPLADKIVDYICKGLTKKDICLLLDLTRVDKNGASVPNISKLNAILQKVGRDLYGEHTVKKDHK